MRAGIFGSARVAPSSGGITGTFQATAGSTANSSSYTFASQPLGAASASRRVVVGVASRGVPVSSVTVGGVALALDVAVGATQEAEIWSGVVASGTTGDVVVTYGSADSYCGIGVWTLSGGAPVNTATATTTGTPALTVATATGDFVVAVLALRVSTAGPSVVWNAATERYDDAVDGAVRQHAGADLVAVGTSTDMGATAANYAAELAGVAACYR